MKKRHKTPIQPMGKSRDIVGIAAQISKIQDKEVKMKHLLNMLLD